MPTIKGFARSFGRAGAIFILALPSLYGHNEHITATRPEWVDLWNFEPLAVSSLLLALVWYSLGLRSMPRKIRKESGWFFLGGWLLLVIALISPIHRWGSWLFSVHMTQHELLMIGAAPLLALSRPGVVMLRALPVDAARGFARAADNLGLTALWRFLIRPSVAWIVHAFALWIWHVPFLFELTFSHEFIHGLQHLSFFGSAFLFWYSIFRHPQYSSNLAWGFFDLFVTALHNSVLGALITFAPRPFYHSYILSAPVWGFSALQDQQLGGVIMWIPAGLVYILATLCLLYNRLRRDDAQVEADLSAIEPPLLSRR